MLDYIKTILWLITNREKSVAFAKSKEINNASEVMKHELDAWLNKHQLLTGRYDILDVGGGDGNNIREFLGHIYHKFKITNIDIDSTGDALNLDITKPCPDEYIEKFDVIYSHNSLEHFCDPHVASDNICKMLKPDGLCIVHTVFSWRYHPVPKDYFRYTDDALMYLFSERNNLTPIRCGYDISRRRENIFGGYFDDKDIPPIDIFGGFRENWGVYYIGCK